MALTQVNGAVSDATEASWRVWLDALTAGIAGVPDALLAEAAARIAAADLVVTAGNGGSASLASHAAQAIAKPSYGPGGGRASVCLTDHTPIITAHTNDGGWPDALVEAARPFFDACPRAVLFALSSSGRSENIHRLAVFAADRGHPVIALTGFDGYPLRGVATVSLHVDSHDYEVVEPAHDALIHRIQAHLRRRHLGD